MFFFEFIPQFQCGCGKIDVQRQCPVVAIRHGRCRHIRCSTIGSVACSWSSVSAESQKLAQEDPRNECQVPVGKRSPHESRQILTNFTITLH